MMPKAGICCLMALLLLCGSCSGCTINNSIEASGGFYTDNISNETTPHTNGKVHRNN